MKLKISLMILVAGLSLGMLSGCSNANRAAFSAWGKKHKVELYSGGKLIGQWTTSGKIENESQSNGYYFQDDKTGNIVMINGDCIITLLN